MLKPLAPAELLLFKQERSAYNSRLMLFASLLLFATVLFFFIQNLVFPGFAPENYFTTLYSRLYLSQLIFTGIMALSMVIVRKWGSLVIAERLSLVYAAIFLCWEAVVACTDVKCGAISSFYGVAMIGAAISLRYHMGYYVGVFLLSILTNLVSTFFIPGTYPVIYLVYMIAYFILSLFFAFILNRLFFENLINKQKLVKYNEELRQISFFDFLTGCYNRRYFQEVLSRQLLLAQRKHQTIALLMIDIDHFKQINDTYGHPVGDSVLASVGETLRLSVRSCDIVSRYGGEEFTVILLLEPTLDTMALVAERIRQAIAEKPIAPLSAPVTVSIGAALLVPGDTEELLINRADNLLYQAKQDGRNRSKVS